MVHKGPEEQGHALVVGNPLPTRSLPLCGAEEEADLVSAWLMSVGFKVHVLARAATLLSVRSSPVVRACALVYIRACACECICSSQPLCVSVCS